MGGAGVGAKASCANEDPFLRGDSLHLVATARKLQRQNKMANRVRIHSERTMSLNLPLVSVGSPPLVCLISCMVHVRPRTGLERLSWPNPSFYLRYEGAKVDIFMVFPRGGSFWRAEGQTKGS